MDEIKELLATRQYTSLRQKLADDPTRPRFIVTEAGVGYRLLDAASFS